MGGIQLCGCSSTFQASLSLPWELSVPCLRFHPPKNHGACDAQPANPISGQNLHDITTLKQNLPMILPPHFRIWLEMMTDQHQRFSTGIAIPAENLPSSSPLHQPLPDGLSQRSRGMYFPPSLRPHVHPVAGECVYYAELLVPLSWERPWVGR